MKVKGEGKYDTACTLARVSSGAQLAAVIVINGAYGSGFSVQSVRPELLHELPEQLEKLAAAIRAQIEAERTGAH